MKKEAKEEPSVSNWENDMKCIEDMRKTMNSPVDTMGCHKLADPLAPPKVHRFQVLVALMLSSQTRDDVNSAAMKRLKDRGLNIDNILSYKDQELMNILNPVSFYKRKTVYLKKVAQYLRDNYDDDIPDTYDGLCALSGVGPKMAHLVMQIAWQKCEGIAVDTHVHRISNRLGGWVKTKTPEETMVKLQQLLPKSHWQPVNHLLVGFGQVLCKPVHPKCSDCLLKNSCPSSSFKEKKVCKQPDEIIKKKKVKIEIKEEETTSELVKKKR